MTVLKFIRNFPVMLHTLIESNFALFFCLFTSYTCTFQKKKANSNVSSRFNLYVVLFFRYEYLCVHQMSMLHWHAKELMLICFDVSTSKEQISVSIRILLSEKNKRSFLFSSRANLASVNQVL